MKKMWIIAAVAVIAVIVILAVFMFVRNHGTPVQNNSTITSFYYSHSGSSTYEMYSYEILVDEESGETVAYYELNNGNETYLLPVDEELMQGLTAIVDNHKLRKWDGFDKTNSLVTDGDGFYLRIGFEDGTTISAHGSNRFPDGYGEAVDAIDELFEGHLKKYGIEHEEDYG